MAYAWCIVMPLLVPLLIVLSLLGYVNHNTLPSRVMLPLRQLVSWVWQGLLSVGMRGLHEGLWHGCGTVLCYTCLYSEKETQGPARLRPVKKWGREGIEPPNLVH